MIAYTSFLKKYIDSLPNLWIIRLTFCNLSISTFPNNSFSIAFISLSIWISGKHFADSRLSRAINSRHLSNIFSSSAILSYDWLIKTVSSNSKTYAMLFSRHSCRQSTCVGSKAGYDVIVSASKSIYSSSVVSLEISVSLLIYYWHTPTSNPQFLKHCLMVSVDTLFQAVWSQVIAFNMWMSSVIWQAVFPSLIRLTT